ncbi:MAG: polysaccharide lyase [Alphaproteobacteria bacterium]|nr:polysaccharide lyase [Alphaproteobacteria bacterium]
MATKIVDYPFSSTFAGINSLQANGTVNTGNNLPNGISGRIEIENGVMKSTLDQNDALSAGGHRSEITSPPQTVPGEYWYKWSLMIPAPWNYDKNMVLMQIHDTPDGGDGARFPNFALGIESGFLAAYVGDVDPPTEGGDTRRIARKHVSFDTWHNLCLHTLWRTDGFGMLELFIDREPIFRRTNVGTAYDDAIGPYFKLGVYDFFSNGDYGTKTAYYKDAQIWSGSGSYETLLGGPPAAKERLVSAG